MQIWIFVFPIFAPFSPIYKGALDRLCSADLLLAIAWPLLNISCDINWRKNVTIWCRIYLALLILCLVAVVLFFLILFIFPFGINWERIYIKKIKCWRRFIKWTILIQKLQGGILWRNGRLPCNLWPDTRQKKNNVSWKKKKFSSISRPFQQKIREKLCEREKCMRQ